jgi:hypothetical protein
VKISRIALLLAAAAVLEFFVGGSRYRAVLPVDWFLLATATVARSGNFVRAVLTGAAAGFAEDAVSQQLLGMNAFAKAILGYFLTIVAVRMVFGGALSRERGHRGAARSAAPAGADRRHHERCHLARRGHRDRRGRARERLGLPVARVVEAEAVAEAAVTGGRARPC